MHKKLALSTIFICISMALCACGEQTPSVPVPSSSTVADASDKIQTNETATSVGTRDNTPRCLVPNNSGTNIIGNEAVDINISNVADGYICVTYKGDASRTRIILTNPQGLSYTYDLYKDVCDAFPLTGESGTYNVGIYEQISGNDYSILFNEDFTASNVNEYSPYLYPNQYVKFDESTKAIALASELSTPANNDLDVVTNVYNYVISNITYDYDKADSVESTYVPVVDDTLATGKGICFDFASLMASMLRSQGIPTRLEIGYAGDVYHAWISTYIKDVGWVNGIIEFDGLNWELMDPTFATTTSEKKLKNYIGEGDNYVTKFMY